MASSSYHRLDLSPEPDLRPTVPSTGNIAPLLSPHSGLAPIQKAELVTHCLSRACVFGDIAVLSYLLTDPYAQAHVDLSMRDEDGVGLVSLTIHGFGAESERDVEREECARLLIAQGADLTADNAGWTPLHHAALLAPPTLISHLMTHGCSPFAVTRRNLTALDIVTAHSTLPGREDVALLMEEAMRGEGWTGGRMEARRRRQEDRVNRKRRKRDTCENVGKLLGVSPGWWDDCDDSDSSSSYSVCEEPECDSLFTPPRDFSSMLVFSPAALPQIFASLIINFKPSLRNAEPANTLYMLARFACLTCDHVWLEDLIIGATDAIEETFFNRAEDVTCLVFWLYNTTLWLHLLQCDNSINEACEMLGSFELIEEVINSIFVFVIRFAERKIDQMLDAAILDHSSHPLESEAVQFESEWSLLRAFGSKKKGGVWKSSSLRNGTSSPTQRTRSPSPSTQTPGSHVASKTFSFKTNFSRARPPSSAMPLQSLFPDSTPSPSPADITSFFTALQNLLILYDINPALTTQLWSQILYWTSCEIFNRILTRKKYLCRSKAVQIGQNVDVIEDWVEQMDLPKGVKSHFVPIRDLLNWLQSLSSMQDFSDLVATIQGLKSLNPLQMRRAVRDYKYEVNEDKMTEECVQYLTQLQKDWERHRVKLGVEALRKEINNNREHGFEDSVSSINDITSSPGHKLSTSTVSSLDAHISHQSIDILFRKRQDKATWDPPKAPNVLGELLDSRYMLPLLFPSDPRLLSALPGKLPLNLDVYGDNQVEVEARCPSRTSTGNSGAMVWRSRNRKLREVGLDMLRWVDGARSSTYWVRPVELDDVEDEVSYENEDRQVRVSSDNSRTFSDSIEIDTSSSVTPFTRTRKPSARKRPSDAGEVTPIARR